MAAKRSSPKRVLLAKAVTLSMFVLLSVRFAHAAEAKIEATYDQAISAYNAGSYDQALKYLDSLEALDLKPSTRAEARNLRAIILMRECDYDAAEVTLHQSLELAPSLSNAKFNLGEISFLDRDWVEARRRFQRILVEDSTELESDVSQLIRFKIFLTFLLQGKEGVAEQIMKQWESASPAGYYARAAIARAQGHAEEGKKWLSVAETKFGQAASKLYLESFYEVGWVQRPETQSRQNFEIASSAESESRLASETGKALLEARDDVAPILREESYNLADDSLKLRQFARARDQLEKLFASATDRQSQQFILYKIFLTFLLEGSDYKANLLLKRFDFTDKIPALYYARGAWAFQHGDSASGRDWVQTAERIYSLAQNGLFLDDFYRLHWLDMTGDQISSSEIKLVSPWLDTLSLPPAPTTLSTWAAASTNAADVSQLFPGMRGQAVPSH